MVPGPRRVDSRFQGGNQEGESICCIFVTFGGGREGLGRLERIEPLGTLEPLGLLGLLGSLGQLGPLERFSKIRSHRTTRNNTEVP